MTLEENAHIEDLEDWSRDHPSQAAPAAEGYRIRIIDEHGNSQKIVIDDATPTGRQIIETGGFLPAIEHALLLLKRDGMLEEINLGDTVDLTAPGVERFFAFRTDRLFYFELDGRRFPWGSGKIDEPLLRRLSGIPDNYNIWQERRGEEDLRLEPGQIVDLEPKGVERFYTGIDETQAGRQDSFLPQADRRYLKEHGINYEEVSDGTQKGIVLRGHAVPGQLEPATTDILAILPPGYPDAPVDSFYALPKITKKSGGYAANTDGTADFFGKTWQFWSRHNKQWRPSVDGIRTVLKRIDTALRAA